MLSTGYNISEFLNKAKTYTYQQVLFMANQEATEVERCMCKKSCAEPDDQRLTEYALTLKDFIAFLRYGVRTRHTRGLDLKYFRYLREMN